MGNPKLHLSADALLTVTLVFFHCDSNSTLPFDHPNATNPVRGHVPQLLRSLLSTVGAGYWFVDAVRGNAVAPPEAAAGRCCRTRPSVQAKIGPVEETRSPVPSSLGGIAAVADWLDERTADLRTQVRQLVAAQGPATGASVVDVIAAAQAACA